VTEHVSDLQWDRLLAGELSAEAGAAAHAHAARCTACAGRLRALTAERDAFRLRPIAIPLSRPRRRWLPALIPVAAAAVVLIALRVRPDPSEEGITERSKGSVVSAGPADSLGVDRAALLLSAGQPDALMPVTTGDVVRPGDYLQAGYTAARSGFGAVLSRDGAGSVTAYAPTDGEKMVPLAPGRERSFPLSTILDATLGDERIAIVWCETAHPLAPLLAALRDGRPITAPDDCAVREVTLDKRGAASGSGLQDKAWWGLTGRPSNPVELRIPGRP
jgi:hypothetical protein